MKYFLVGSFFVSVLTGQSGYDIAKKLDEKEQPKDLIYRTSMVLTNSKGTVSYTHLTLPTSDLV